ncbi:YybH family protein [Denitromonas iodatirespirans]|uniref:Nuclear transport factor 2 family protein n=1 Tax=Denitromonas iodatirespirans TaxID=2795389 RepID=A0A944DDZ1_DENI1|nr:nuclear transport factor 2 family protein [Denitromonas iodatirespirans]MBT0962582.1 nuclear transport factor 2 family protein [Denitromonas iodatirespirans]
MSDIAFTSPHEVEVAFYAALARADLEAMMAVWSEDEDIVCVHPGAPRVVGLAAVRNTWQQLFASGPRLKIEISQQVISAGSVMAMHSVLQHVHLEGDDELHPPIVATNIFVLGARGWRMVAHHASPTPDLHAGDPDAPMLVH